MASRAMIVVAGGTSTRFGGEKLMAEAAGYPLLAHTVRAVVDHAEATVVSVRADLAEDVEALDLGVTVTTGGATRTDSEIAGLAALGREYDLIGIHDGARPLVGHELIEKLFREADVVGGAVPTQEVEDLLIDRRSLELITDPVAVQTPQVFRGPELLAAYVQAAQTDYEGHDTVDVVQRFSDLKVAAIPGDPGNIKVTFPRDLEAVRTVLEARARNGPR